MAEKCVVGYKRATLEEAHIYVHGKVFDQLEPCCQEFKRWFESTGARKVPSFNAPHEKEKNGFNLTTRDSMQTLVIRVDLSNSNSIESKINFCPFCGAKIEVKCTKSVTLKRRMKEVFDGYDEEVQWEEGGENPQGRFREVLNEASERVAAWPEWKKSDALRSSESDLKEHLPKT